MKILQFKNLLLLLLLIPGIAFSQDDLLYKKDSTILRVNIRSFDGKTIMYQIPGDTAGISHFMSCSVLDSLRYGDGKSVDFTREHKNLEAEVKMTGRNYFSTELVNLLTGKPNLEYERISKTGKTGYVLGFLINYNLTENGSWEKYPYIFEFINFSPYYFFVRTGINFYPFSQSLARPGITRTSTGFSLLVGSYRKIDYTTYYETGFKTIHVPAGSLMWNIKEKLFAGDHVILSGAMEVSVIPFLIFFCPQIGVSVGF
jgi:hypothetical protein